MVSPANTEGRIGKGREYNIHRRRRKVICKKKHTFEYFDT